MQRSERNVNFIDNSLNDEYQKMCSVNVAIHAGTIKGIAHDQPLSALSRKSQSD